jgi:acetyltransferase
MANAGLQGEIAIKVAREIANVARRSDKPILLGWSARTEVAGAAYALVDEAHVPHYHSPLRCMRALGVITQHAAACRRYEAQRAEPVLALSSASAHAMLINARTDLAEYQAKSLLAEYGIPVTVEALATDAAEAAAIAARVGFPVGSKCSPPTFRTRPEAGGVRLELTNTADVKNAFETSASVRAYKPTRNRWSAGAGDGEGQRRSDSMSITIAVRPR